MLLLLPERRELFPLSTAALSQAQASREKLQQDYRDAYLLDGDGSVCRIENVVVIGPFGDRWARRLLSRMTQGWRIQVRLSPPLDWDLERLRRTVLDCLSAPDEVDTPPVAEVARDVRSATSGAAIFRAMRLPPPEEALDVL